MNNRQWGALAVFTVVPAGLLALWLSRTRPENTNCDKDYPADRAEIVGDWLAGARPLLAIAALTVLGVLLLVSRWRNESRPSRPDRSGTPTRVLVVLLTPYTLACVIEPLFFLIIAIPLLLAGMYSVVSIPVAAAASGWWISRRPSDDRVWAVIQTVGWWALFAGIAGVGVFVGEPVTDKLCFN